MFDTVAMIITSARNPNRAKSKSMVRRRRKGGSWGSGWAESYIEECAVLREVAIATAMV
jgi:hypothetical protein